MIPVPDQRQPADDEPSSATRRAEEIRKSYPGWRVWRSLSTWYASGPWLEGGLIHAPSPELLGAELAERTGVTSNALALAAGGAWPIVQAPGRICVVAYGRPDEELVIQVTENEVREILSIGGATVSDVPAPVGPDLLAWLHGRDRALRREGWRISKVRSMTARIVTFRATP